MARRYFSSTATATTLSSGMDTSVTDMTVSSTSGFPTSYPFTIVVEEGVAGKEELCDVTAAGTGGATWTVTRGVDGTSGRSHSSGAVVRHAVSGRDFDEANAHVNASSGVHGLSGSVVGTSDSQTLSNKTLTAPVIATISNTGTLTLPTSTDTLVGRATTDTLTNKTISGASNTVSNLSPSAVTGTAVVTSDARLSDTRTPTDLSVTTGKIADSAVTTAKINASAVDASKIASGAVGSTQIASGAVTTAKIAAGAVTTTELGTDSVTAAKIAAGAVDTSELATGAVTTAKIAAGAVTATELGSSAVTNAKIAAGAVDTAQLATDAVTAAKIAAGAVDTSELATGAVTTAKIADGNVTQAKLSGDLASVTFGKNSYDVGSTGGWSSGYLEVNTGLSSGVTGFVGTLTTTNPRILTIIALNAHGDGGTGGANGYVRLYLQNNSGTAITSGSQYIHWIAW